MLYPSLKLPLDFHFKQHATPLEIPFTLVVNKIKLLNLSVNLYNNKSSKIGNMFDAGNENKHSQEIVYCIVFMAKETITFLENSILFERKAASNVFF